MKEETSGFNIAEAETLDKNYQVIRLVHESESGYCRILEVRHSGRLFIAKTLKPQYRNSSAHISLLQKEYDILSSLYHPSIIQAFGIVEIENEGPALILEYAHGVTLHNYLLSEKPSKEKAFAILQQICSAIDYCHKRGVIHRDLKPANIIIYPQGPIVKIIDFNFSHSPSYTAPPLPGGTKGFSAPEEFTVQKESLPYADIWSIGKIMEALLPNGNRRWQQVKNQCLSLPPEKRPSSASLIPSLLKEKDKSWKQLAVILTIFFAIGGFFLYLFLNRESENEKIVSPNDNLTVNDSTATSLSSNEIDTVSLSSPEEYAINQDGENGSEFELKGENVGAPVSSESSKPSDSKVAEETVGTPLVYNNKEDLIAVVKSKSEEAAAKRFKEQLAILDTATSFRSISLAKAGHWRWKARQDVAAWLKTQNVPFTNKSELSAIAKLAIQKYSDLHYGEIKKALQQAFYDRGVVWVMGDNTKSKEYLGNGEYLIKELDEDGDWKTRIERKD